MTLEQRIIAEAQSWIGTPFQHQGRRKGSGVDCLGLLVGIAANLALRGADGKLLVARDHLAYGHYPDERQLRAKLQDALVEQEGAEIIPAGIGLFNIDHSARHLGVFSTSEAGHIQLIHAYAPARSVVEHRFDKEWLGRLVTVFTVPQQVTSGGQAARTASVDPVAQVDRAIDS